jgi:2-dehydro-3-deoxyphosphogluconate aldolase / (4S)-4-hydroxy-2-oxoglutarate aldolase
MSEVSGVSTAPAARWTTCAAIADARCIGILRSGSAAAAASAGRALVEGGITVVEVAFTTPGAPAAIAELGAACPDALVGAGTVLDAAAAFAAVQAGARFLVSPLVSEDVLRAGHRYGVAVIPGAATPTEINAAMELGADAVKLFPAGSLGVGYLRAVAAAMPQVPFVPTGGITAQDAPQWLAAGAIAVGVGGDLTGGDPDGIVDRARLLARALRG